MQLTINLPDDFLIRRWLNQLQKLLVKQIEQMNFRRLWIKGLRLNFWVAAVERLISGSEMKICHLLRLMACIDFQKRN